MAGLKESQHLALSFKEIEVATENFQTCIGKGGYGRVYKGELVIAGKHTLVAVKRLNENPRQGLKEFLTEIQLLTDQKHPNLISLLGYCDEEKEKILVYEYVERGSLDRYIKPSDTSYCLTWLERLKICVSAARGLDHLHNHVGKHQTIIHRDIKSSNILLDENWVAKISDFGLSRLCLAGLDRSAVISYACGTPGYCEPEYITTGIVTKKSDVYSFGIVLFELLSGRLCTLKGDDGLSVKLVKEYYQKKKMEEIVHPLLRKQMTTSYINKFSKIAYKCLQDDRKKRPPMEDVKKELKELLKNEPTGFRPLQSDLKTGILSGAGFIIRFTIGSLALLMDALNTSVPWLHFIMLGIIRSIIGGLALLMDALNTSVSRLHFIMLGIIRFTIDDLPLLMDALNTSVQRFHVYLSVIGDRLTVGVNDRSIKRVLLIYGALSVALVILLFTIRACFLILVFGFLYELLIFWPAYREGLEESMSMSDLIYIVLMNGLVYLTFVVLLFVVLPFVYWVFPFLSRVSSFWVLFVILVIWLYFHI